MNREELRENYGNDICELCYQENFINKAYPERLCEDRYCDLAEEEFAYEHNIELED